MTEHSDRPPRAPAPKSRPSSRHRRPARPDTRYKRGQSGNPAGRPLGSRNAATMLVEMMLHGEARALTRQAVNLALAGDTAALKLCL